MTIEERISDDLRQLSADLYSTSWQTAKGDESAEKGNEKPASPKSAGKGKGEPDLKNKASRLLDLMISLGEIERRGGKKPS